MSRYIVVSGPAGLPYSKGLMATSLTTIGLPPLRAHEIAERIEHQLFEEQRFEVSREELRDIATSVIAQMAGPKHAETYRRWHRVEDLEEPLIVLIGGATGVGKSTVATQLAARLGITRVISTDAIREVMRGLFSKEIMPALHVSSFNADEALPFTVQKTRSMDPLIIGFQEQVRAVTAGVHSLIDRAVLERTDLIVEGSHLVPGFIGEQWTERAVVVHVVVTVDEEDAHRSHFLLRGQENKLRMYDRYLTSFQNIRKVQKYIRSLALQRGVPVIPSYSLDTTLAAVVDLVVAQAVERAGPGEADAKPTQEARA